MRVHEIDAKGTESNEDMGITSNANDRSHVLDLRVGAFSTSKGRVE